MSELKPVVTKEDINLVWDAEDGTGYEAGNILLDKIRSVNQPLYAIPEGYHIVAIDPEQAIRDTLDSHNDKLRGDHKGGNNLKAGWYKEMCQKAADAANDKLRDNQPRKGTTLQAN